MKQQISPEQVKIKKAIRVMVKIALRFLDGKNQLNKCGATGKFQPGTPVPPSIGNMCSSR
ncbi:MAG: hypothetical protein VR68_00970 [Peptococcaceae bacterium BRH_c4a]|nr:MAG: hypothetical protein VR68_00970 [Peptococcaceae bacterium BRH_c4a]